MPKPSLFPEADGGIVVQAHPPEDSTLTSQGEKFRSWIEDLLNESGGDMNGIDSLVHSIDRGIFVVIPDAFRFFAERNATRPDLVQTEFGNLGIHLKNPDSENPDHWRVRLAGFGNHSFRTGWIVPAGNLHLKCQSVVNDNAVLMNR